MIIRLAAKSDAADISEIWNSYIRNTSITFTTDEKTPTSIAELITQKAENGLPFLIAEDQGKILGSATYGAFRNGPGYSFTVEHSIMLSDTAKRGGIGRALMTALEAEAQKNDINSLVAGISAENQDAIAFHEVIGFKKVGHVAQVGHKFGRWMDLILLQKMLDCRTDKPE